MKCRAIIGMMLMTLLASCSDDKPGAEVEKEVGVTYSLSAVANPTEGGSVTPQQGTYKAGTKLSIKATPNADYVFTGWSGSSTSEDNPLSLTVSGNVNLTANFKLREYPLSLTIEGEGTVKETVVSTRSDYAVGTVVELTAVPDEGWQFKEWQGDISGTENSVNITISSSKSVKAVFIRNQYSYNLKIVGPGVVDEYLVETKNGLEYGSTIQLKAYPDVTKKALFKGWSGDITGDDSEISFCLDKDISIVATFSTEVKKHPVPNLLLPTSLRKDIFYDVKFPVYNCEYCALDYNLDGYVDLVTCINSGEIDKRIPIQFYTGQPDGSFLKDEINSDRFDGLIWWRKSLYGDFNGDGIPDICFVGHGWDAEPWPGEYPVLLLSTGNGQYKETRFSDIVGYFHGSAAGDFDNDGDLDIFLLDHSTNSYFLVNDGMGHFTPTQTLHNSLAINGSLYTAEMFDINHDGYLDLIVGGHEHEGPEWHQYTNQTYVFWGNGKSFNHDNYSRFPKFEIGWGVTLDYIFEDLDGDGYEEVINCRTGDGFGRDSYIGWKIQIVSYDGTSFKDVTNQYFRNDEGFDDKAIWLVKISIEEIDGDKYLIGLNCSGVKQKLFKINGKNFIRCEEESTQPSKYTNGLCFYSDGVGLRGNYVQLNCTENPYSGKTCIHFSNWSTWDGWSVDYDDWVDFSELEKQGYVLEFAIRNTDPELEIGFSFETRLQTEPWYFPTYGYTYFGSEHICNGSWELVRVPLTNMICDPEWTGYYWDTIKTLNIMAGWCHGIDFYLDEIRIRKIADINN